MDLHALTTLGQATVYPDTHDAGLLQPIPRRLAREALGLAGDGAAPLPFIGVDLWTHYELSWLEPGGKPVVAVGEIRVPADSPALIESKSLKLYFNSLNFTRFATPADFTALVEGELSQAAGAPVTLTLLPADAPLRFDGLPGRCLDDLPLSIEDRREPDPGLLRCDPSRIVDETWHSHLLRSNCPVTGQPDWGSVVVRCHGPRIDPDSLLAYLVSFRRHADFHEQCVERIFLALQALTGAALLTVHARYTRRGGLDINPFRSTAEELAGSWRTVRQ